MVQPFTAGKCLATCERDNQLHTCRADEGIVCEIPKDELEYLWGIQYLCGQSVKKHLWLWAVPTKSLLTLQYFAPEFHLCPNGWCELLQHHCWEISQATLVPEGTPGWVQSHLSWWHWNQSRRIVTTDNFSFVWNQQWGILKMEEHISSLLLQMEDSTISKDLVETTYVSTNRIPQHKFKYFEPGMGMQEVSIDTLYWVICSYYQKRWLQGHKSFFFYETETLAPMSSHVGIKLTTKEIMEEEEKHVSWLFCEYNHHCIEKPRLGNNTWKVYNH